MVFPATYHGVVELRVIFHLRFDSRRGASSIIIYNFHLKLKLKSLLLEKHTVVADNTFGRDLE